MVLPDGGGCVVSEPGCGWEDVAGGRVELVTRLRTFIAESGAELVLTFDPRHGSTCHPDHRAIGALTIEAISGIDSPPQLWLNDTILTGHDETTFDFRRFEIDDSSYSVRADVPIGCSFTGWSLIHEVAARHSSQFSNEEKVALERIEESGFVDFSWLRWTPDFTWPVVNSCPVQLN